jgi:putative endonuclease
MQKYYYVYILASKRNGTLYIGVTSNLYNRIYEHKNHMLPGFTKTYNVTKLVYFEHFKNINDAIHREKRLKEWQRNWKKDLIEKENPEWKDLFDNLIMMLPSVL